MSGPFGFYYRSIGFMTDSIAFIGKVAKSGFTPADTFTLYRTTDGGTTWNGVYVPGLPNTLTGFCGMSVVNDSVMYASGRYNGPAAMYKTTDQGNTWTYINMQAYAGGLVDCHFWTPDSGLVIGTTGTWQDSSGVILSTSDGGQTWQTRHITSRKGELCWKLTFPSRKIGYVSLEDVDGGDQFCLKTTDGGQTWQDILIAADTTYNSEGIGFLNDSVGWMGGGNSNQVFQTVDGGASWTKVTLGKILNRFRFFGDSLGYASGDYLYKLDTNLLSAQAALAATKDALGDAYPNPAAGAALVPYTLSTAGPVTLRLLDVVGRPVRQVAAGTQAAGFHQTELSTAGLAPGLYTYQLQTPQGSWSRKLLVQP